MPPRKVPDQVRLPCDLLHEFLLQWAELTPDNPAVIQPGGDVVSYRQLRELASGYAARLDAAGLGAGDRVVLESDTSAAAIAMVLACSASGVIYVPVSSETPVPRRLAIIESAGPALYLRAAGQPEWALPRGLGAGVFGLDGLSIDADPMTRRSRWRTATPADPAYIIFTSGSTGRPKGVVMSHRAALAFFRGMLACDIVAPGGRVASTAPFQFDFSLLDIGLALGSGAAVVPVPRDVLRWPRRFVGFLADAEVTQVNGVPSMWRSVLRHEPEALARLDRISGILYSGEPFPLPELRQLQELLPNARIVNCFGSTESIASSLTDVPNPLPAEPERLSIGFAHRGANMELIDESGNPVNSAGVVGEIYLRSAALFSGYWDDPEATAKALVPDPLNPRSGQRVFRTGDLAYLGEQGEMYFCGRADAQVKIRGNRIDLGEVEHRIREFPGVADVAAVVPSAPGCEPVLVAWVVLAPGAELDAVKLTAFCTETLPDYMAPQRIVELAELPLTPNGKVDRKTLAGQVLERRSGNQAACW